MSHLLGLLLGLIFGPTLLGIAGIFVFVVTKYKIPLSDFAGGFGLFFGLMAIGLGYIVAFVKI